jgi:two-component system cell cycle sensor histidine kinase/response regulator CckA
MHTGKERRISIVDPEQKPESREYALPDLYRSDKRYLVQEEAGLTSTARILVVEDESIVALDIKSGLESLGYEVVALVSNGEDAIQKAVDLQPDLVLMDIQLKGEMDGIEAAQHIQTQLDIPVIYLTAYTDQVTLKRAKITEPFGYLLKPFEERELHTNIEMALYKQRTEKRLKESERWLAITLKSIGDGVIATDAQGYIQFINPVAQALTGWSQEAAQGKDFEEVLHIIHEETRVRIESPVARALGMGQVILLGDDVILVAKDGTEIPIDDSAAPIWNDTGGISGVVVVFRDISVQRQTQEALRQYASELEARNEDLDAFAHTVAHNLKAPLNPMIGFATLLEQDYRTLSEDELREYLQVIAQSGHKMSNIVEELLLLAQARSKDVEITPLPMGRIVAEVESQLAYVIEEYQAEIIISETWPIAQGYGPWIEEVWANYISNGIKYGGQPPRLELGATELPDGMIRFWVSDNGPGLTLEEQSELFKPFTRLSQVRATGSGLGLSIVRHIVEKLGGQVGVESEVGHGSTFFFTLPRATT